MPSYHLDKRAADIAETVAATGDDDVLLSTSDVAELTGTSTQYWEVLRSKGGGPPYVRLSPRRVRYRRSDLIAWLRDRTYEATRKYSSEWNKPQGRPKLTAVVSKESIVD
jgi:predicted DNA-binding transcriptional regulator AlpA